MTLNECYEIFEGSIDETKARLVTEDRIKKFLRMFPNDTSFDELCTAMNEKDYVLAFRSAHTLKGLCLNLGIESLRKSASDMTEALRGNTNNGADELFPKVVEDYNAVISAINALD